VTHGTSTSRPQTCFPTRALVGDISRIMLKVASHVGDRLMQHRRDSPPHTVYSVARNGTEPSSRSRNLNRFLGTLSIDPLLTLVRTVYRASVIPTECNCAVTLRRARHIDLQHLAVPSGHVRKRSIFDPREHDPGISGKSRFGQSQELISQNYAPDSRDDARRSTEIERLFSIRAASERRAHEPTYRAALETLPTSCWAQ
jgi:hypothetical protein